MRHSSWRYVHKIRASFNDVLARYGKRTHFLDIKMRGKVECNQVYLKLVARGSCFQCLTEDYQCKPTVLQSWRHGKQSVYHGQKSDTFIRRGEGGWYGLRWFLACIWWKGRGSWWRRRIRGLAARNRTVSRAHRPHTDTSEWWGGGNVVKHDIFKLGHKYFGHCEDKGDLICVGKYEEIITGLIKIV